MSDRLFGKMSRAASASFLNAVRLHDDAILLYDNGRVPSALHASVLSIEELGKFMIYEDMYWHNRIEGEWEEKQIQASLKSTYSHKTKQKWFAGQGFEQQVAKPLLRIFQSGLLDEVKQRATYVGFPRDRSRVHYEKRLQTPFGTSKKLTEEYITVVNDFLITMALGTRKGAYVVDIPQVASSLMEPSFELHLSEAWPRTRPSTARWLKKHRKLDEIG
jgi:AbiV family abortive infection protein